MTSAHSRKILVLFSIDGVYLVIFLKELSHWKVKRTSLFCNFFSLSTFTRCHLSVLEVTENSIIEKVNKEKNSEPIESVKLTNWNRIRLILQQTEMSCPHAVLPQKFRLREKSSIRFWSLFHIFRHVANAQHFTLVFDHRLRSENSLSRIVVCAPSLCYGHAKWRRIFMKS